MGIDEVILPRVCTEAEVRILQGVRRRDRDLILPFRMLPLLP